MTRKMALAAVAALALWIITAAPAAGPGDNLNYRTTIVVKHLRGCVAAVTLTRKIIGLNGSDLEVSRSASQAKSICDSHSKAIGRTNTKHFTNEALDAQVAIDYWEKGLGRMVDYIDSRATSDLVKMQEYWATARSYSLGAVVSINKARKKYGLPPLKQLSIPGIG